ncbi:MAG: 4-(cytidine 5'-diphospho)-2-C-methyl-D-erythritol kinase [Gammaproteobacteria bacterium]|nr:4-(cytidine 5'-diphospho)-2-C-methyl-D-erythritol kinase [Gammaproteobacteria bacterium]MCP5136276.1 4-(cytidine 5'-diphospho)-2-C-methyl-D-erythritol kinase [Gammaproteobacteria bacterium]
MSFCDPWPAPAKINLFLHIVGRRPDGFHLLQTVFQFVDWCDWLSFEVNDSGAVTRRGGLAHVPEDADLTVRAARLLQAETGCRKGVQIAIDKRLPEGGGLGGGSSDAATVLVALNRLWDLELGVDRLAELGLSLGADVPVFVRGHAAWAEGVGECLTPVEPETPWYALVVPEIKVNTGRVFQDPELTRNTPLTTIRALLDGGSAGIGHNDCETVVRQRYPEVDAAFTHLARFAPPRMTGTGATVFAAFSSRESAQAAISDLPKTWQGRVARGLNRSPLMDR